MPFPIFCAGLTAFGTSDVRTCNSDCKPVGARSEARHEAGRHEAGR